MQWFTPFSRVDNPALGTTLITRSPAATSDAQWSAPNRKSAFFGEFASSRTRRCQLVRREAPRSPRHPAVSCAGAACAFDASARQSPTVTTRCGLVLPLSSPHPSPRPWARGRHRDRRRDQARLLVGEGARCRAGREAPSWAEVKEGALVGALRLDADLNDIRGRRQAPASTPCASAPAANGDHLGVSPYREFLLPAPAAADTDLAPLGHDGVVESPKKPSAAPIRPR